MFYLRTLFSGLDRVAPRQKPRPAIDLEAELIEEEISEEVKHRQEIMQRTVRLAESDPERIASVINKWLLENGG